MLQPFLLDSTSSEDIQLVASCDTDGTTKVMGAESCSPLAEANPNGLGESSDICAHPCAAHDASCGACGSASGGSASGCAAHAPSSATLDLRGAHEATTFWQSDHLRSAALRADISGARTKHNELPNKNQE